MRTRRGQALMELAAGMFAVALVAGCICVFAIFIAKSLRVQNSLRSLAGTSNLNSYNRFFGTFKPHGFADCNEGYDYYYRFIRKYDDKKC